MALTASYDGWWLFSACVYANSEYEQNRSYTKPMKQFSTFLGILVFLTLLTTPSWAVQAHGGAEGLVSHQIGHALFILGMGYLLFRLYRIQMKGSGWFEFKVFLWVIIAWNLLTFSGHWMHECVSPGKFIKSDGSTISFTISSFTDAYFYLTRLDHLLLVPSFAFLVLALRKWRLS